MKKIILGLTVLIGMASCQEQQKIGFIDNSDVIDDYQMKIDIEKRYQDLNEKFIQKRDSIGRVYQLEMQSAQVRLANMSEQKKQEESQVFNQRWQPVQQQIQYEKQQMEQMFQNEMDSVLKSLNEFVESYGEDNDYTFILGKNPAGSVMYGKDVNDISLDVTKAINKAYKNKDSKTEETDAKAEADSKE